MTRNEEIQLKTEKNYLRLSFINKTRMPHHGERLDQALHVKYQRILS